MYRITLAMHRYHAEHGTLPPAFTVDTSGMPLHSWRVLLLPYLGEKEELLYTKIKLDEPWNSDHNKRFHEESLPVFTCPSTWKSIEKPGRTAYSVVLGEETPFDTSGKGKPMPENRDTILIVETLHERHWMDPGNELTLEDAMNPPTGPRLTDAIGMGSFHTGGMNVGKSSGSVDFISQKTPEELRFH